MGIMECTSACCQSDYDFYSSEYRSKRKKQFISLLVYIFLATVCFTASNLSYNTMLSLVTTERHDRNVMNTIRFEFTMIAQLVINVITIPLVHFLETARRAGSA